MFSLTAYWAMVRELDESSLFSRDQVLGSRRSLGRRHGCAFMRDRFLECTKVIRAKPGYDRRSGFDSSLEAYTSFLPPPLPRRDFDLPWAELATDEGSSWLVVPCKALSRILALLRFTNLDVSDDGTRRNSKTSCFFPYDVFPLAGSIATPTRATGTRC